MTVLHNFVPPISEDGYTAHKLILANLFGNPELFITASKSNNIV